MATLRLKPGAKYVPKAPTRKLTLGKLKPWRAPPRTSKYRVGTKLASYRKPGWSDEARAAAYRSRMANARGYKVLAAGGRFGANLRHLRIGTVAALANARHNVVKVKRAGKRRKGGILQAFGTYKSGYTKQVVRAVRRGGPLPDYRMPKPKESRLRLSTRAKAPPVSGKRKLYKGI